MFSPPLSAPTETDDEPVYPGSAGRRGGARAALGPAGMNWRFRVPDGEELLHRSGDWESRRTIAGKDFGDFLDVADATICRLTSWRW